MDIPKVTKCLISDEHLVNSYVEFVDLLNLPSSSRMDLVSRSRNLTMTSYEKVRDALDTWKSCNESASVEALRDTLMKGGYKRSAESLKELCLTTPRHKSSRFGFPDIVARRICGRSEEVSTLLGYYDKGGPTTIVLVAAVGGQGKTTLALAFINRLESKGANLVATWLNGSAIAPLTNSIRELCKNFDSPIVDDNGRQLSLEVALYKVGSTIRRLESAGLRWVVILDNVDATYDEVPAVMESLMRHSDFLIVTSRNTNVVPYECDLLRLGPLDEEGAHSLVKEYLPSISAVDLEQLCHRLGCYALGLRHSVAFIKYMQQHSNLGSAYTIQHYLAELEKNIVKTGPTLPEYSSTTEAIFRVTMSQIASMNGGGVSIFLLRVLSLVNGDGVSIDYLDQINQNCYLTGFRDLIQPTTQSALHLLKQCALIDVENNVVTTHRIVQIVVKQLTSMDSQLGPLLTSILATYMLRSHRTRANLPNFVKIYEEAYECEDVLKKFEFLDLPLVAALSGHGSHAELVNFTTKCFSKFEKIYGALHKHTLRAKKNYEAATMQEAPTGMQACNQSNLSLVQNVTLHGCFEQLETLKRSPGPITLKKKEVRDPIAKLIEIKEKTQLEVLRKIREISVELFLCGRWKDTWEILQVILKEEENLYGALDKRTIHTRIHMATLLFYETQFESAKKELRGIIQSSEATMGNVAFIHARRVLAHCLHALGETEDARKLMTQVFLSSTRVLGVTSSTTVWLQDTQLNWGCPVVDS